MDWIIIAILILLVAVGIEILTSPEAKGRAGEEKIYTILERIEGHKRILANCYLPNGNSGTTEIDLILLHETGIYVFESKNYSGWIFGSEDQQFWTETFRGANGKAQKQRFYNPLWQNTTHIRALKRVLKDRKNPYYSYVVFGNNCEFKNIELTSGEHIVTTRRYLRRDLLRQMEQTKPCMTAGEIDAIYDTLCLFTNADEEQKEQHIESIMQKQVPVVGEDGMWYCPRCGGQLVRRIAQRGNFAGREFWGCSNYPRCHFIYNP